MVPVYVVGKGRSMQVPVAIVRKGKSVVVVVKGRILNHHVHVCMTINSVVRVPWHISSSPCMCVV